MIAHWASTARMRIPCNARSRRWVNGCFAVQDYVSALSALDNLLGQGLKNRGLPTYETMRIRALAALGRKDESIVFAEQHNTGRPGQEDKDFWNTSTS